MGIKVSICVTVGNSNNNNGEYKGEGGGEERTRAEEIISQKWVKEKGFFPSFRLS